MFPYDFIQMEDEKLVELLENPRLREYIYTPSDASIAYWQRYLREKPTEVQNFRKAVLIVKALGEFPAKEALEVQPAWERFERVTFLSSVFQVRSRMPGWGLVASVFLVSIASLLFFLVQWNTVYETTSGEITRFSLADGSQVTLHANSRFIEKKFPWLGSKRGGRLEGQGYFTVQKGEKTFAVTTQLFEVEVVGTQFEVATRPWKKGIYVQEGKVNVTLPDVQAGKIVLTQNQQLELEKTGNWTKKETVPFVASKWVNGEFNWLNASIEEVAKEIESIYSIQIELDASVSQKMISASLPIVKTPTELLDMLANGLEIKWEKSKENEYRLF